MVGHFFSLTDLSRLDLKTCKKSHIIIQNLRRLKKIKKKMRQFNKTNQNRKSVVIYKDNLDSFFFPIHVFRSVWTSAYEEDRVSLLNGNHPCPLQMDCGHACPRACHPPAKCLPADQCTKRAVVKCACGSIKQETLCKNVPITPRIPCNRVCEQRLDKKRKQVCSWLCFLFLTTFCSAFRLFFLHSLSIAVFYSDLSLNRVLIFSGINQICARSSIFVV